MSSAIPWILISVAVLVILLAFLGALLFVKRKKPHKPDYYTFFIMGIIWTAFGLIFWNDMFFFFVMGIAFMIIGIVNKDKWKSNRRTWKDMEDIERKILVWAMFILGLLVLAGLVVFFLVDKGVI